jgi:hypothetical protein
MVLCAPNAASSSHMKRCAGFGNLACPEGMVCELGEGEPRFDGHGTCVPERL